MTMQIPFTVSARAARLIGRENIASFKGAIIELVKNCYDADSPFCIVYFDNKYSGSLDTISVDFFEELKEKGLSVDLLSTCYGLRDNSYVLNKQVPQDIKELLYKQANKLNALYIIDGGEGMTFSVIKNHWMTIGTDNKANDVFTSSGRVKSGAKGIGRFALDKLGAKCEMITQFNIHTNPNITPEDVDYLGYKWSVNWDDFEGSSKTIGDVNALLSPLKQGILKNEIYSLKNDSLSQLEVAAKLNFGTILKISDLRDNWEDYFVNQVFMDLEVLIPPRDIQPFTIYLYSSMNPCKYGEITGSICDDYDYKVVAKADEQQNVSIEIFRSESDTNLIPSIVFNRKNMSLFPYRKSEFLAKTFVIKKTFAELIPGYKDVDGENVLSQIGSFLFVMYYLKRGYSSEDGKRFYYKQIHLNERKNWLDKFCGVKLFRDNFRVRPYGEVGNTAFDWLGLGSRKAASPAGIAKHGGGYKVEPKNISGMVSISRLSNISFEDKSSREGLQENSAFNVLQLLLESIISIFENDRAYIAREFAQYAIDSNPVMRNKEVADELVKTILSSSQAAIGEQKDTTQASQELVMLAQLVQDNQKEIEQLKEEQKLLRVLASSGIVLAAFSHDFGAMRDKISERVDRVVKLFSEKISQEEYLSIEDRKNPFYLLDRMKKEDKKLLNWISFSLEAAKKDKRKRKQLSLKAYFTGFIHNWNTALDMKKIIFQLDLKEDIDLRIFEIDFDSIFNNLLINSIHAFTLLKEERKREIKICINLYQNNKVVIDYFDTGPGLSKDIDNHEQIFEPLFTTKRNQHNGHEEGTGLGMWIIKSVVKENDGDIQILDPSIGFGIKISLPIKY